MRHEVLRYFNHWMDFYKIPDDKRSDITYAIENLFNVFDEAVSSQIHVKWKKNRTSSKSD